MTSWKQKIGVVNSHEHNGMGVGRIRTFPFSSDCADCDSVVYNLLKTRLSESEAEAEG